MSAAELVLAGGRVIDPASGVDAVADVAIAGGRIAAVSPRISAPSARVVDVPGCIVTPGIIDIHTHVYPFERNGMSSVEGIEADAHLLRSGVTTTVDTGTTGWRDFARFKERHIDRSIVRILAYLNIAGGGMIRAESEQSPREMDPKVAATVAAAYPDVIVGIKTAHYWTVKPFDEEHPPWASVDRALEAATLCGKPVMVDFWPRPPERPYPELILGKLRPGDVHTHVFAQQFPVVTREGKVEEHLRLARERGVSFDLGHGAGSFWFRNAAPALADGFPPDTISTDLHTANLNGPVLSMATTMSKLMALGMGLTEVISRSTSIPARVIGRPELGTLRSGSEADVAVFRLEQGRFGFTDCGRARAWGREKLDCVLTVRSGRVVYDPGGLSMPEWREAPPEYWEIRR